MRFDLALLRRVLSLGVLVGLTGGAAWADPGSNGTSDNSLVPIIPPKQNAASCVKLYNENKYQDALDFCRNVVFQYIPQLQTLKDNLRDHKNPEAVSRLTNDMFDITYTLAFVYKHFSEPENAVQAARHAVGWGLMYLGIYSDFNKNDHSNNYNPEIISTVQKIEKLDKFFPGVRAAEVKQLQESGAATP